MGMVNFNPLKNAASNAQSYLNKIFKNAPAQTPQQMTGGLPGMQQGIPGYGNNPYQVQQGDTFETIAQKNNMTTAQLQAANNGMAVPPPKGSFIDIPKLAQAQADYYNRNNSGANAPVGYGPYWQNQQNNPAVAAANNPSGYTTNSFTGPNGQVNTAELIANIQNSPTAPTTVPGGVLSALTINGAPATPQSMQANGYEFNQATQSWVLKGSQAAQGMLTTGAGTGSAEFMNTGFMQRYAEKGTPFLQQKRWDPSTRKFVSIGKLIRQGKLDLQGHTHKGKKKGNAPTPVAVAPASNAGGTPGTVLDLHLGSG